MKIDRRSFLSLVAGGAVGAALTPLPIKLMDDSSIWAQSFKYTPIEVPVPADGAASYKDTVCTLCPGGCGLSVRKIDQRAVKVEGRAGYPVNDGSVCALGLSNLHLLYGPWRVKQPMKKEGDQWKAISWDKALSEISDKLSKIRQSGKANTIAGILPDKDGTVARLTKRFLTACGSPNVFSVPSDKDAGKVATQKLLGKAAPLGYDFESSSFVLSFSAGLLDGWGSPVRMARANSLWKDKGTTLVQVEPRLSNTAAKADQWVPINPGTEADLALGLAQVIIRDYLYDRKVTEAGNGFDKLSELLKKEYTPAKVAQITNVEEPVIEELAKKFAKAPNPVAVCGRGNGQQPVSAREAMAVLTLNALVGSINRRGGVSTVTAPDYIKWDAPALDAIARQGLSRPRLDGAAGSMPSRLHRLADIINKKGEAAVAALLVAEANPAYTLHNASAIAEAMKKVPLKISLTSYLDETATLADYILPLHTCLERQEDVPVTAGLATPVVGLAQPVTKPLLDTRHPGDVILALAQKMGGSVAAAFPWRDYEDCLQTTLGDNWSTLADQGYIQKTPFGLTMATATVDFAALASLTSKPKTCPKGGLMLVPYDSMRMAEDNLGTPPMALKTTLDTVIKTEKKTTYAVAEINPATAGQFSLSDGKIVTLTTPAGSAKVKLHLSNGIAPGLLAMPRGLGHTAYDDYLADKGVNVNELVAPEEDPVSGLDVAWGTTAKLA